MMRLIAWPISDAMTDLLKARFESVDIAQFEKMVGDRIGSQYVLRCDEYQWPFFELQHKPAADVDADVVRSLANEAAEIILALAGPKP